jgi:hypothetical protein
MLRKLSDLKAARVRDFIVGMAVPEQDRGYNFDPEWIQNRGWCVVPVEDSSHFNNEEIRCIISALDTAGSKLCFAIAAPDLPTEFANVYELSVSEEGFEAFNAEFSIFRVLLTATDRSWAISCNEWFNLFAGPEGLVERMLGVSIGEARREFLAYAGMVEQGGTEGLMRVARQYS